ncbi:MAG: class D beta-lactamase [Flavobacteriales bacterium]|nr:class D beta-lactamase [Flavobacteriales bacterium]
MRNLLISLLPILILSCENKENKEDLKSTSSAEVIVPEFQTILDSSDLEGAILIFDKKNNTYYSNSFTESRVQHLPASTFKIPNSIIGLELNILENERTIFKWDGSERYLPVWEQDLSLRDAFQTSCVPCYQELARKIGVDEMKKYVKKLKFGQMDIGEETIDNFWLMGPSKISPYEQVYFLKQLREEQLPISKSTHETIKIILEIESTDSYTLSGKTGLSVYGEKDVGWFVGFVEKHGNVYYFATKISPKSNDIDRNDFNSLRQEVSIKALNEMDIIE